MFKNYFNYNNVAVLNYNGSTDSSFQYNIATNGHINTSFRQDDGKLLVAGEFNYFNDQQYKNIVRLNPDGTIDSTFKAPYFTGGSLNSGTIYKIRVVDNTILLAGSFESPRKGLVKLDMNGNLISSFNPQFPTTDTNFSTNKIYSFDIQSDKKIVVARTKYIQRYNFDGSIDNTFNIVTGNYDDSFYVVKILEDNKIMIGGLFNTINSTNINKLARLNNNGTIDNTFNPGAGIATGEQINTINVLNGKYLIGGAFSNYDNNLARGLASINPDGSFNTNFNANGYNGGFIRNIDIDTNENIIISGHISTNNVYILKKTNLSTKESDKLSFQIYPNPVNNELNIITNVSLLNKNYIIYDSSAKIAQQGTLRKEKKVNVGNLNSGFYQIQIDKNATIKFIKK